MTLNNRIKDSLFEFFLSEKSRKVIEHYILVLALVSFVIHLVLIFLVNFDLINFLADSELLLNPISAIYTPFSFILIYEVYLLIYYLPKSFTYYITKQYEIITLIIIRRLFKDLSSLELSSQWFEIKDDLQFTYDIIASLLLFYLIYLFQRYGKRKIDDNENLPSQTKDFISKKKSIAIILVPLFLIMASYTFINWLSGISLASKELPDLTSINNLFFDQFFTVLILVDVVLLLTSFFYVNQFHKIIRNSGFIISTILIRISFGVTGLINTLLIIVAVLFGLFIVVIHNQYDKKIKRL